MKSLLGNDAMNAILLGGASLVVAALATQLVQDLDDR
jgi:hypothetical protein